MSLQLSNKEISSGDGPQYLILIRTFQNVVADFTPTHVAVEVREASRLI